MSALVMAGAFTLAMGAAGVSANEPGYGHGAEKTDTEAAATA